MTIRLRYFLISCVLLAGCAPPEPSGMARRKFAVRQPASDHVAQPQPEAPTLKRLKNGRYRVSKPWTVRLHGRSWQVPAGYTTNGITGPSWIRKSLGNGVNRPETWSAVFHDWLFTQPGITRSQADNIFHDLLIAYGVPPFKARLMHSGVAAYSASKALR